MQQKTYRLKELCRAADVTERTVRYYIEEGLLPPPEGAGPFSRYNYEHWLRLQFIRRLKEEFLPLSEIKNLLAGKSVADLDKLARRSGLLDELPSQAQNAEVAASAPVAEKPLMLRQIMTTPAVVPETVAPANFMPPAARAGAPMSMPTLGAAMPATSTARMRTMAFSQRKTPETSPAPAPLTSQPDANFTRTDEPVSQSWERIKIAPGIELHIESNIANQHRPALDLLLREIRKLLGK